LFYDILFLMPLIKRYPNRKLYNTEEKKYITLDEIAGLIRKGQEIHVLDHVTNEDLTSLTLTQVILEEEKRHSGFLPGSILASLVRSGGNATHIIYHALASSFGFLNLVDEEINRRIDALIEDGKVAVEEALRWQEFLLSPQSSAVDHDKKTGKKLKEEKVDETIIQRLFKGRKIPTRTDIERLSTQLDEISEIIDQISPRKS
jgi:polyhydroxyalkanoate synthesis repressor PhaR